MELTKLVALINRRLAGEQFTYSELEAYLDDAIDQINTRLDAAFPVFSEFTSVTAGYPNYAFFPDRYLRMYVVPAVAAKFYSVDEEGAGGAQDYRMEAEQALFLMERDYSNSVPEAYQAAAKQGLLPQLDTNEDRGLEIYGEF